MNGLGNRFVIADARKNSGFSPAEPQIIALAEKHKIDQFILMTDDFHSDVVMRIWNSDGSEVAACGNATRCVGYLIGTERGKDMINIASPAGPLVAYRTDSPTKIRVDMGQPRQNWQDIPLEENMDVMGVDVKIGPMDNPYLSRPAVVSMGNPHAVFFVDDVDAYDIPAIGPLIEWHPLFPEGTNVGFAQIIDRETIRLRVWERGAGLTQACGTGACAALVCATRARKTERAAKLILDGGELEIAWDANNNHVYMTGETQLEAELEV